MEVVMEVSRAGAEAEVEMMTVGTHVATETVPTNQAAETEIFIEEVVAHAHALEVQIDIIAHAVSVASVMM